MQITYSMLIEYKCSEREKQDDTTRIGFNLAEEEILKWDHAQLPPEFAAWSQQHPLMKKYRYWWKNLKLLLFENYI